MFGLLANAVRASAGKGLSYIVCLATVPDRDGEQAYDLNLNMEDPSFWAGGRENVLKNCRNRKGVLTLIRGVGFSQALKHGSIPEIKGGKVLFRQ